MLGSSELYEEFKRVLENRGFGGGRENSRV